MKDMNYKSYIDKNKFINESEKIFLKNNIYLLADFEKKLDIAYVKSHIATLIINYHKNQQLKYNKDKDVTADYNNKLNEIRIFCADNIEECLLCVIIHEFLHAISKSSCKGFGIGLNEAITESIACEFCDITKIKKRSYATECLILYSLCELIGTDVLLDYYFNGNINLVKDSLIKINGSEIDALTLLIDLDDLITKSPKDQTYKLKTYEIYGLIDKYVVAKYNKDIIHVPIFRTYLYNNRFEYDTTEELNDFDCKGYFYKRYINDHPFIDNDDPMLLVEFISNKIFNKINNMSITRNSILNVKRNVNKVLKKVL